MSNEHYELFCRADLSGLTQLDRQVLGHYCQRFNESVIPPHAWPPLDELVRITGADPKSISRSIGRINNKHSLLIRITLASKKHGKRAEYAINLPLLRSLDQVTEQLPKSKDVTHLQVTDEALSGNASVPISNPPVTGKELTGYPKRIKPIKPRNVEINYERWSNFIKLLPAHLQGLTPSKELETCLDLLATKGAPLQVIARHLSECDYSGVESATGLAVKRLRDFSQTYAPTYQPPAFVAEPIKLNPPPIGLLDNYRKQFGTGL